jgi:nitrite reductase/ring-hydroxylating ferredoxin subunit
MTPPPDSACAGCIQRRDFVRDAACMLLALGIGGATAPRALAAMQRDPSRPEERRYPVPATDGVAIDAESSVIVARAGGKVYAFSLACPHQNTALRWDAGDAQFRCPKHKSRYRPDGSFIEGRATRAMDRHAVRRDGTVIVVDLDTLYERDKQPAEWDAAFVSP